MILSKCFTKTLFHKCGDTVLKIQTAKITNRALIGNRDWVGFGKNGTACYSDELEVPFPAIRFKENNNELLALREKEKGDWRKLTIDEKKTLYRASFRQTIIETLAPTGNWKKVLAGCLVCLGISLWAFYFVHKFYYTAMPPTFTDSHKAAILRCKLDLKEGHLTGISSKWDYEKDTWKK